MARRTGIEWTEMTWNPVTGCSKISKGCANCYAERMAYRLRAMGSPRYSRGFDVTLHEDLVDLPERWKQPRMVFVNSMSDLFHEEVPGAFVRRVFSTMRRCSHHQFQLLTKRADRLAALAGTLPWADNIWVGVTVESREYVSRIDALRLVPAEVRFLSLEPLLEPLGQLDLSGIHWVVVGGESGPNARGMDARWVEAVYDQCMAAHVPFFFKQWGGVHKHRNGRVLFGQTFDELPAIAYRAGHATGGRDHLEQLAA